MSTRTRRKCRHCGQVLRPDPRNVRHQRYCSAPACRRASKAASQRRWLAKEANRDYFRGTISIALDDGRNLSRIIDTSVEIACVRVVVDTDNQSLLHLKRSWGELIQSIKYS